MTVGSRRPGDDLKSLLGDYADGYRPDRDRIMARLDEGRWPVRPDRSLLPRVILVGATALLLMVAGLTAAQLVPTGSEVAAGEGDDPDGAGRGAADDTGPALSDYSDRDPEDSDDASSGDDDAGEEDELSALELSDDTLSTSPNDAWPIPTTGDPVESTPSSIGGTGAPSPVERVGELSVEPLPDRIQLSPDDDYLDWMVLGPTSDGTTITLDGRSSMLSIEPGATPTRTAAPLEVDWIGGQPEASGTGNDRWWTVENHSQATRVIVRPEEGELPQEISLITAAAGPVSVTVKVVGGPDIAATPVSEEGGFAGVITVGLAPQQQGLPLFIDLLVAEGDSLSLAAVTVR